MGAVTEAQRVLAESYANGEYAHLADCGDATAFLREAERAGDTLFAFLAGEMGDTEELGGLDEALRRIESARADMDGVRAAMEAARTAGRPGAGT